MRRDKHLRTLEACPHLRPLHLLPSPMLEVVLGSASYSLETILLPFLGIHYPSECAHAHSGVENLVSRLIHLLFRSAVSRVLSLYIVLFINTRCLGLL